MILGSIRTTEENRKLIEKYPFLYPRYKWSMHELEDYDYSFTELDEMPYGWRKTFGEEMCEEIAEILKRCGAPATKMSLGWISPFCDKCAEDLPNIRFEDLNDETIL